MTLSSLTAISPLDGRYHEKLNDLRPIFSEFALMKFRTLVEIRWLQTLAHHAQLPELSPLSNHADSILNHIIDNFSEKEAQRIKHIESGINHDVKAIEYFIKERIAGNSELAALSEFIHFGCTSEDINNIAYGLMLQSARQQIILPGLDELLDVLKNFAHLYADTALLARTHGQPATPTTVGKEFANVISRLQRQREALVSAPILGKLNGATGNYNAFHIAYPLIDWQLISKNFVSQLGLIWNPYTTQIEPHDYLAEFFAILIRIHTILIDFNRDIWGYIALDYFQQKTLAAEVGSSTMPHKVNPIDFENAEGNLGLANALLDHMMMKLPLSRWQRDLTDSTVLRNMGVAIGYGVLAFQSTLKGLHKLKVNEDKLQEELDHHWEILAEAIQTVMRRYGIPEPYEKLKQFTRGQKINKTVLHAFIADLNLPEEVKQTLYALTPSHYLGYASDLAKRI